MNLKGTMRRMVAEQSSTRATSLVIYKKKFHNTNAKGKMIQVPLEVKKTKAPLEISMARNDLK